MCEICKEVMTVDAFSNTKVYLDCLKYIQALVDSGDYSFESKDCDTDKVRDENGCWADDIIFHTIKCAKCGQIFICSANTYRGSGSFRTV